MKYARQKAQQEEELNNGMAFGSFKLCSCLPAVFERPHHADDCRNRHSGRLLLVLGMMHNYATDAAKRRSDHTGGFYDFRKQDADAVPNWITVVNMGFSFLGVLLLIAGIVLRLSK